MSRDIGTLPPFGTWANYPGSRARLDGGNATRQRATGTVVPGLGWARFKVGVVGSLLDGVRTKRQTNTIADPEPAQNGAVRVAGI